MNQEILEAKTAFENSAELLRRAQRIFDKDLTTYAEAMLKALRTTANNTGGRIDG